MNKLKLFALAITCFPLLAQAVDVYDKEYDKKGYVSFVMKQGEVSEQVVELLNRMYPEYNVFFRQEVNGYLPSDLELSGESRETIAVEMLAGLGLSACVYENNIIELGKFKKRGICPTVKMKNGSYPKVDKIARGTLSFTNEWFGNFDPVYVDEQPSATVASFYTNVTSGPVEDIVGPTSMPPVYQKMASTEEVIVQPTKTTVSFEFKEGNLLPQVEKLVSRMDKSPKLVWKLDENLQWFNDNIIERDSYEEILAVVLLSYDAFADVYLNDAIVIREAEGF